MTSHSRSARQGQRLRIIVAAFGLVLGCDGAPAASPNSTPDASTDARAVETPPDAGMDAAAMDVPAVKPPPDAGDASTMDHYEADVPWTDVGGDDADGAVPEADAGPGDVGPPAEPPPEGAWGYVPPAGTSPLGQPFALPAGQLSRPLLVVDSEARVWASGIPLARDIPSDGREQANLLVALDRDGRLLGRVRSPGAVVLDSILADADGAYVAGSFAGSASIADAPWDSGATSEAFVARYTARGERLWAMRLGATIARGGASLSRTDVGAALLLSFRGELRAGPHRVSPLPDAQIARVDLGLDGSVSRALSLGPANGEQIKGAALRGGGTMLWNSPGASPGPILATFEADGRVRWSHAVRHRFTEFDERGIAWLANSDAMTAVDDTGRTLWSVSLPLPRNGFYTPTEVLTGSCVFSRHGEMLVLMCGAQAEFRSSCDPGQYVAEYWVDSTGRIVVPATIPLSFPGFSRFGGMALGPGRVCRLHSVNGATATAISPGVGWRLACDGLAASACRAGYCGACAADLLTDDLNCGACGRPCAADADGAIGTCLRGVCVTQGCSAHRADCDRELANGCEVGLALSATNCGGCGVECPGGASCRAGRCCRDTECSSAIWPSDASEGAFAPTSDTTLPAGVHRFSTVAVPAGVTVRTTAEGVLDLRATGDVRVDGTFDLRGGRGGAGGAETLAAGGGTAGANGAPPGNRGVGPGGGGGAREGDGAGPAPGYRGLPAIGPGPGGRCFPRACPTSLEQVDDLRYQGALNDSCSACAYGISDCFAIPGVASGDGSGGAIGSRAMLDLPVRSTFRPGSGGGASSVIGGAGGGGGGGALRLSSATRILVGAVAALRVDGGPGGVPGGGAGSGGVIVLAAPELRVAAGAVVSAAGGGPLGGLGRVAVTAAPAQCSLAGTFTPPLREGCAPTSTLGYSNVNPWPY